MKGYYPLELTTIDGKPVFVKYRMNDSEEYLLCELFYQERKKLFGVELKATKMVKIDIPFAYKMRDASQIITLDEADKWTFEDFEKRALVLAERTLKKHNKEIENSIKVRRIKNKLNQ